MTSIAMTESRFWTLGRGLRWMGLLLLLMVAMPVVVGLTAGYLHRLHPDQNWDMLGKIIALTLFAAGLALGSARLWTKYRNHLGSDANGMGEQQANRKRIAVSGIWRDALIAGLVIGVASSFAATMPSGLTRGALATIAALALAYGLVRSTFHYMRTIDEQERDANLWGGYCGVSVYLSLALTLFIATRFGVVVPYGHEIIFVVTIITVAGVYFWKRFR